MTHFLYNVKRNVLFKFQKPSEIIKDSTKSDLTNHRVSKFIWTQCLKAKILGAKCNLLTRLMYQNSRNLKAYIRQHFDSVHSVASHNKKRKLEVYGEEREVKIVKVHDDVCDILRVELDTLSEVIFTGKVCLDLLYLLFQRHKKRKRLSTCLLYNFF